MNLQFFIELLGVNHFEANEVEADVTNQSGTLTTLVIEAVRISYFTFNFISGMFINLSRLEIFAGDVVPAEIYDWAKEIDRR